VPGDPHALRVEWNALEGLVAQRLVQYGPDILLAVAVGCLTPARLVAEGLLRLDPFPATPPLSEALPPGAAQGVLVVGSQHQISGAGQRFHQEHRLGVAAAKAVGENDQGVSGGWSRAVRLPDSHATPGDLDLLRLLGGQGPGSKQEKQQPCQSWSRHRGELSVLQRGAMQLVAGLAG